MFWYRGNLDYLPSLIPFYLSIFIYPSIFLLIYICNEFIYIFVYHTLKRVGILATGCRRQGPKNDAKMPKLAQNQRRKQCKNLLRNSGCRRVVRYDLYIYIYICKYLNINYIYLAMYIFPSFTVSPLKFLFKLIYFLYIFPFLPNNVLQNFLHYNFTDLYMQLINLLNQYLFFYSSTYVYILCIISGKKSKNDGNQNFDANFLRRFFHWFESVLAFCVIFGRFASFFGPCHPQSSQLPGCRLFTSISTHPFIYLSIHTYIYLSTYISIYQRGNMMYVWMFFRLCK